MPVTRQMELDGFQRIMKNVLNVTAETLLTLGQLGIDTIPDLLNEPFDTLNKLDYFPSTVDNPTKKSVARGSIRNRPLCTIRPHLRLDYRHARSVNSLPDAR